MSGVAARDNDFLREMLLELEASAEYLHPIGGVAGLSEEEEKREYHAHLACDAGLLVETRAAVFRITNAGHDYIEAIRSDSVWRKTQESVAQLGGATLGMVRDIAVAYIKQEAADRLGIHLSKKVGWGSTPPWHANGGVEPHPTTQPSCSPPLNLHDWQRNHPGSRSSGFKT